MDTGPLAFALQQRKTLEILSYETVDEGCATSHSLKWDLLSLNELGNISRREKEGGKSHNKAFMTRWRRSMLYGFVHHNLILIMNEGSFTKGNRKLGTFSHG